MEKNHTSFGIEEESMDNFRMPKITSSSPHPVMSVIDLTSSESDSDSDSDGGYASVNNKGLNKNKNRNKKMKIDESQASLVLPLGFLDPLPIAERSLSCSPSVSLALPALPNKPKDSTANGVETNTKQFWKAGDYEGAAITGDWESSSGGMDHVRVHPRFLHSNATSHKWVLGAFAELLDNSLDESCNGATYVNIDMINNKKDGSRMLLIEDDGGGMDPDKMRQCMSLGYSVKSKIANTIGQYGNGFKTSTMRLGADVIVFSRCCGKDGKRSTQSIGLLSYTFLRRTGKEDIVVPMLDYERVGQKWRKITRSSTSDRSRNIDTIIQWSPFSSEADLLQQFNRIQDHGTLIISYNLWEDDQGLLELDFDANPHDIQIRGVNRDEKSIRMAKEYPNSRHFLTYRHSLRSYASILYLRIPPGFRIILRGRDVEHHNIVNDMMMTQEVTYRPQPVTDGVPRDLNMVAVVTIGFVKDARAHIDVQGFNVYHKNRLIKPFWRVWHPPGSDGRGVIGVLEANFVEPAHDKQGFERTTVLSRLEAKLVQMQKTYWSTHCHRIGYAPRSNRKSVHESEEFLEDPIQTSKSTKKDSVASGKAQGSENKYSLRSKSPEKSNRNHHLQKKDIQNKFSGKRTSYEPSSPSGEDVGDDMIPATSKRIHKSTYLQESLSSKRMCGKAGAQAVNSSLETRRSDVQPHSSKTGMHVNLDDQGDEITGNNLSNGLDKLKEENRILKERLKRKEDEILGELLNDLKDEKDKSKLLEAQLVGANKKIEELNKEQESLVDIFSEERQRRDLEEENLRKKLQEASNTIQELLDKIRLLEKTRSPSTGKYQ